MEMEMEMKMEEEEMRRVRITSFKLESSCCFDFTISRESRESRDSSSSLQIHWHTLMSPLYYYINTGGTIHTLMYTSGKVKCSPCSPLNKNNF